MSDRPTIQRLELEIAYLSRKLKEANNEIKLLTIAKENLQHELSVVCNG